VVTAAILGGALGSLAFLLPSFALGVASALRHLTYARSTLIPLSTGVGTVLGASSSTRGRAASASRPPRDPAKTHPAVKLVYAGIFAFVVWMLFFMK
jgi:hypothetical protein